MTEEVLLLLIFSGSTVISTVVFVVLSIIEDEMSIDEGQLVAFVFPLSLIVSCTCSLVFYLYDNDFCKYFISIGAGIIVFLICKFLSQKLKNYFK